MVTGTATWWRVTRPEPVNRFRATTLPRSHTGNAAYASNVALVNPAHAYLVTSSIAKGRFNGFDLAAAKQVRGLIDIMTHENAEWLKDAKLLSNGGYTSTMIQPLKSADIGHEGQIIAVVLAETFEAAREASHLVKVSYTAAAPTTTFDSPGTTGPRKQRPWAYRCRFPVKINGSAWWRRSLLNCDHCVGMTWMM